MESDPELQHSVLLRRIVADLINDKLAEMGVVLRTHQVENLYSTLDIDEFESLRIDLDPGQEATLESFRDPESGSVTIDFTDISQELIEDKYNEEVSGAIERIRINKSQFLMRDWDRSGRKNLRAQNRTRSRFQKRLRRHWGKSLDSLDVLISVCLDAGLKFNNLHSPQASREEDLVFEVLARLHARSCQISAEIHTLLRNGFADGAMARWRTLHEVAVVSMFIRDSGAETAERYLDHSSITNYNEAVHYQRHYEALHYEPLDDQVMISLKEARDQACDIYGKSFSTDYGWASKELDNPNPGFAQIEEAVSLQHIRPFFKLANINVHAGSKSILFRLGSPPYGDEILVAGPSIYGLAEPGQNTAYSINQATVTFLLSRPSLETLAFTTASTELVNRIYEEFSSKSAELDELDRDIAY